MKTKTEKIQMWIAVLLTAGEWTIAIIAVWQHCEIVMLYLAVTYAIRETSGGKHYHEIVWDAVTRLRRKIP